MRTSCLQSSKVILFSKECDVTDDNPCVPLFSSLTFLTIMFCILLGVNSTWQAGFPPWTRITGGNKNSFLCSLMCWCKQNSWGPKSSTDLLKGLDMTRPTLISFLFPLCFQTDPANPSIVPHTAVDSSIQNKFLHTMQFEKTVGPKGIKIDKIKFS